MLHDDKGDMLAVRHDISLGMVLERGILIYVIECVSLLILAAAAPASFSDVTDKPWYASLAETAAPLVHGIVAAGFENCKYVKELFGLTYDQVQARNTPDTDRSLYIDLITPSGSQKLNISSINIVQRSTNFNPINPLVILIHGFMESSGGQMVQEVSQAFLEKGGYNVMALDGKEMINVMYFRSTTYVRFMGEKLGQVLADLVNESDLSPSNISIVGHSLGAHIAGISGQEFHRLLGTRLGRITGLDPAGPCFDKDDDVGLRRGDAEFVDVIHTDGGLLGLKEPVGDQDYFPNGGSVQPGCVVPPCCHSRAWQLYAESVKISKAFPAWSCKNWDDYRSGSCVKEPASYMGVDAAPGRPGLYFLDTAGSQPYSRVENDDIYVS